MRHLITIFITTFFCSATFAQQDSIGVIIPKDDASTTNLKTKHMWVGLKNNIASNYIGSDKFLRVWADNGIVDSNAFCVTPLKPGKVTVFSVQQIYNGEKWDTIETKNYFTAIEAPKIKIKIINEDIQKDSTIQFALVDKKTNKEMTKRYRVGRMYEPVIYNSQDSLIGAINPCFGMTIEKNKLRPFMKKHKIQKGDKIKMRLDIRDTQTDLLIPTEALTYIFK
jgi:hypothetical protein